MVERQPLQQTILGLLLAWALIAQLTYSGFLLYLQANATWFAQVPFYTRAYSAVISELPESYSDSGLHAEDEVIALNGRPVVGEDQLDQLRFGSKPGDTLAVTVRRPGHPAPLTVSVRLHEASAQWTKVLVLSVLLPLSCLLVGFYIAFARPRDPLAWITLGMLASFGQVAGSGVSWFISSPWRELLFVYHAILSNSWPLWLVLFALYFPVPFPGWSRWRWLSWLLAVPAVVLTSLDIYGYLTAGEHLGELRWLASFIERVDPYINLLFTVYVFGFFILLAFKKAVARDPDSRRRLTLMSVGCSIALVPLLPVVFLNLPAWLNTICLLMVIHFPITMAYVIVVQRAMEIRTVVRTGVRYALAANGIKILRLVLTAAVVIVTIYLEQQSSRRWEGILIAAAGVALIVTVGKFGKRVSFWMDRRFFREAYDAELILTDLSSSVAGIRDVRTLLQTVARRISVSLHVDRIAVLLEQGHHYEPAYALGFDGVLPLAVLARESATVRLLKQARSPSRIYFDDPQSWIFGTPESEQRVMRGLSSQLLLPLALNSRLMGFISLGAKKSEAPYSQADLHLLSAVASQTGLALENAELAETVRRETAKRERLNRELEIARDVQQHLFPQKLPTVEGLDFAGYCRPAEGVGGDYYDFLRLPDGCLGLAVGDVSGKGIAAALMMASLQASLRGQTIKPCESLSEMIGNINRLVYDASSDNRYATFFYAQYDPHTRLVRYVNAGHNSPIVLRRIDGMNQVTRLEEGGTVVGLFPSYSFQEGQLQLQAGDILVAYTDGISEAMNKLEEEFEEEKLIDALRNHKARTAAELISELLDRVDRFTAGATQHDDMTLLVVRVK